MMATKRWSKSLDIYALNIATDVSWQAVTPPLLRALAVYGMQIPAIKLDVPPFHEISFWLGSSSCL